LWVEVSLDGERKPRWVSGRSRRGCATRGRAGVACDRAHHRAGDE
jgi:hypothetical protein